MITCLEDPRTRTPRDAFAGECPESNSTTVPETYAELPEPPVREEAASPPPQSNSLEEQADPPRTFRLRRFLAGFSLSGVGMALILAIGVSLMHVRTMGSELAMPLVGLAVIMGVMCVGGGFGLMATSYSGFDEREFDRLIDGDAPHPPLLSVSAGGESAAERSQEA